MHSRHMRRSVGGEVQALAGCVECCSWQLLAYSRGSCYIVWTADHLFNLLYVVAGSNTTLGSELANVET